MNCWIYVSYDKSTYKYSERDVGQMPPENLKIDHYKTTAELHLSLRTWDAKIGHAQKKLVIPQECGTRAKKAPLAAADRCTRGLTGDGSMGAYATYTRQSRVRNDIALSSCDVQFQICRDYAPCRTAPGQHLVRYPLRRPRAVG